MGTHDVIRDIFTTIAQDVNFHVGQKQVHALPSTTFHSSCQQVNIVLTKYGIYTLANVIIADQNEWFILSILHNLKICCFQSNSSQRKKLSRLTPH
jgi:hypothetical protein